MYNFATVDTRAEIFKEQFSRWISSFFALTLATNIICTGKTSHAAITSWLTSEHIPLIGLVAYKIWKVNKLSVRVGATNLMPVFLVVIESGALYSATLIALLATYLAGSWAQYLLIDALTPIIVRTLRSCHGIIANTPSRASSSASSSSV